MASIKSRVVALVLRHTRKKAFASAAEMNRWIKRARLTEDHHPPARIARRLRVETRDVCGFPVYEVEPKGGATSGKRILYLHGGAYVFEITSYHWVLIAEMAERLGARLVVPIYPIAPTHDFHAMFGMVMQVYERMLLESDADDIVFMGDSAGGNMAVVLCLMAAERGLPSPGAQVLISPGLDMSLQNPAVRAMENVDPWLAIPGGLEAVRHYSAGIARTDWRISPIFGDLSRLPRTLIFSGMLELLYPDTVRFAEKATALGREVELVLEPGMFHVWPLVDIPEAHRARNRIVAFLRDLEKPAPAPRETKRSRREAPGMLVTAV